MTGLSRSSSTDEIVAHLRAIASEENRAGLARYGIKADTALGIPHGVQRKIAKAIGRDNRRSLQLWQTSIREARLIGAFSADAKTFSSDDARRWTADFDSWEMVDGVSDLFVDMECWRDLIEEFAGDEREFVRRTAFAMMAWSVVHRKKEPSATFLHFLSLVEKHARDDRNFVKKALSWALRSIGKGSLQLNEAALALAGKLAASTDRTEHWLGKEAMKELSSPTLRKKLAEKASGGPKKSA